MDLMRATKATSKPKEVPFPEASTGFCLSSPFKHVCLPHESRHCVFTIFCFVFVFFSFFVPWSLAIVPFGKTNLGSYEFFFSF